MSFQWQGGYYYPPCFFDLQKTAILDSNGTIVVKYTYDAWGNHKVYDGYDREITSATFIGNLNPFRYRGYFYDTETKLYFLQTRYYDPEVGRFLNMDSVDYADPEAINGLNLYAYCGNDPVNNIDPTGTFSFREFLDGIGNFFNGLGNGLKQLGDNLVNLFRFDNGFADDFGFDISIGLGNNHNYLNDIASFAETVIKKCTDCLDYVLLNLDKVMFPRGSFLWNEIFPMIAQNGKYNIAFSCVGGAITMLTLNELSPIAWALGPVGTIFGIFSALVAFWAAWEEWRKRKNEEKNN